MSLLAILAANAGLPIIEKILKRKLGDQGGQLAGDILQAIAVQAKVPVDGLESLANDMPGKVIDAMRTVETTSAADKVDLYLKQTEAQLAMFQAEQDGPAWVSAWRPAGMYLIGFLWLWNSVLLHIANAIWKIALPPMPFPDLIQLSGLYMGLYMGGHTVKDVVAKWAAHKVGGQ